MSTGSTELNIARQTTWTAGALGTVPGQGTLELAVREGPVGSEEQNTSDTEAKGGRIQRDLYDSGNTESL